MACDFGVYRLAGSNQIALIHEPQGNADTGFGVKGTSTITVQVGTAAPQPVQSYDLWLPQVIIATLPANLPSGAATVRINITGLAPCTSSAALQDAGTTLPSDLIFSIALPEVVYPDKDVEVVNLKPGFTWQQSHTPVKLYRLNGTSLPVTVVGGIGTSRLKVHMPTSSALAMTTNLEQMLLGFGTDPQRVPIMLQRDPKTLPDWADLAVVTPSIAAPGTVLTVDVVEPPLIFGPGEMFLFNKADLGDLHLFQVAGTQALPDPTLVTGWGTSQLKVTLPDASALNLPAGVKTPVFLKFDKRTATLGLSIDIPPVPQLLWWLRVGRLTCDQKNEWSDDETRIEITFDGAVFVSIPQVKPGDIPADVFDTFAKKGDFIDYDVWAGPFTSKVEIELWEIDNGRQGGIAGIDPDDKIGATKTLTPGNTGASDITFQGAGATYRLSHFVKGFTGLPV